ncbi:MAG: DUF882 domain-containing protein [Alphaproteobacteria bacterium]|nr:DUF882 domain-containing protein [Alphaproteobacteria bacterium]
MFEIMSQPTLEEKGVGRRDILKMGLIGTLASTVPFLFVGEAKAASTPYRVNFTNTHTNETFNGVYRVGNKYLPQAFERINHILRDHRSGEVFPMDPRVIDIMAAVQRKARRPIEIFSGYRCPKTNARLRKASTGVAQNSFHMYGQALDMHINDFGTSNLRNIALGLKAGGVGYYPKSKFVHVDTGNVRTWNG